MSSKMCALKTLRWVVWIAWLLLCAIGTYALSRAGGTGAHEATQMATLVVIVWLGIPVARRCTAGSRRRS